MTYILSWQNIIRELLLTAWSTQQDQEDNRRQGILAASPTLWNAPPDKLRALGSLKAFMARLKTHYFKLAFSL